MAARIAPSRQQHTGPHPAQRELTATNHEAVPLPAFVAPRQNIKPGEALRNFWAVRECGDWWQDIESGRDHARDALRFMRQEKVPHVLNWIVADMIRRHAIGPIEIGFFHELGLVLLNQGGAPA